MNWQEFLNHPDVVNTMEEKPDEYLFGLIMHDCSHCLNLIEAAISMDKDGQILPETIRGLLYDLNAHYIHNWINKLYKFQQELSNPHLAKNYEELIREAGRIFEQLPSIIEKINEWDFPKNDLLQVIIRNVQDLLGLCKMIEQGDYLLIWNRTYGLPSHGKLLYREYPNTKV